MNKDDFIAEYGQEVYNLLLSEFCGNEEDAEEALKEFQGRHEDFKDYARELVEDCYFTSDTPKIFKDYFDIDAFAKDLRHDYLILESGVFVYIFSNG